MAESEEKKAVSERGKPGLHQGEQIFFEWKAPEYRNLRAIKKNLRSLLFFGGLLFIWAIYSSNFLFAAILGIVGFIFWVLSEEGRTKAHHFIITDSGIWVDGLLQAFIEFKYFSVLPEMTKTDKFFLFTKNKGQRFRLVVPAENSEKMRLLINRYVPQKEYQASLFDMFERMLR